ncbi:MAG: hypothetical protein DLM53_00545 [Candidatus Eremiobacter antarcticus]|nr:MAG: hypothetical protein DLM53_00545 [Candidatus Eremiobacter sp. RRmetagenome_bin22]
MPVLFIVEAPAATTELYEKISQRMKQETQPPERLFQAAAPADGQGMIFVEVWDSEQARERWVAKLDQVVEELGGFTQMPRIKKYIIYDMESAKSAAR